MTNVNDIPRHMNVVQVRVFAQLQDFHHCMRLNCFKCLDKNRAIPCPCDKILQFLCLFSGHLSYILMSDVLFYADIAVLTFVPFSSIYKPHLVCCSVHQLWLVAFVLYFPTAQPLHFASHTTHRFVHYFCGGNCLRNIFC